MGSVTEENVGNFALFLMSYQRSLYVHLLPSYDTKTPKFRGFQVVDLPILYFSEKMDTEIKSLGAIERPNCFGRLFLEFFFDFFFVFFRRLQENCPLFYEATL